MDAPANYQDDLVISSGLADIIDSWRRTVRGAVDNGQGTSRTLAEASKDIWNVLRVDRTVHPDRAPYSRQVAVDALNEFANALGLGSDDAQQVFAEYFKAASPSTVPDDGEAARDETQQTTPTIAARPYEFVEPNKIPMRDRLYGSHLFRGICSAIISPGGVGKSTLTIAETLARVTNRPLLGARAYHRPLRCWLWNLEDPHDEQQRKIQAACLHYGIAAEDIGDRLYVNGREDSLIIARQMPSGGAVLSPVIDALVAELVKRKIDVLTIDPFVSCHQVSENDNSLIDGVAKAWGAVAGRAGCAVELVHHARKIGPDAEVTAETARGASALVDACRAVRVLNRMTKEEAQRADVENNRLYFRVSTDKQNLAPPSAVAEWYELAGIDLGNGPTDGQGDSVQVVKRWEWPNALDGVSAADLLSVQRRIGEGDWRASAQAQEWAGKAVADVLHLDLDDPADKARVKALLKTWLESGALKVISKDDEKRRPRDFIVVGQLATPA